MLKYLFDPYKLPHIFLTEVIVGYFTYLKLLQFYIILFTYKLSSANVIQFIKQL